VDSQAFEPALNADLRARPHRMRGGGTARIAVVELAAADEQLADRQHRHACPTGLSLHQNPLPEQAEDPDLVVETDLGGGQANQIQVSLDILSARHGTGCGEL
jgi:hypothetical protein